MADGAALVLTGAPGAGKSAVLESLSGLLGDEGVGHAAFESEQLAWGEPWLSLEATMPQLAALCRLQRDAAEPATVAARIAAREPGSWSGKARLVEHARELAAVIPALAGIDLVLPTEGEAADDVARRVRGAMAAHGMLGS
jgi:energy-coupling factor transporter ATP-binding protein EcfA2